MLPNIKQNKTTMSTEKFIIKLDSVEDLFFDAQSNINPVAEVKKIQNVLNKHIDKVNLSYTKNGGESMNRENFEHFMEQAIGIGGITASEIFSCSTSLYGATDDAKDEGDDTYMTKSEFATAIVRISNLFAMMNDGMSNTSELANQTDSFLNSL